MILIIDLDQLLLFLASFYIIYYSVFVIHNGFILLLRWQKYIWQHWPTTMRPHEVQNTSPNEIQTRTKKILMNIYDNNHRFRPYFPDFDDILRTISIGHINPLPNYFVNLTAKLLAGIWQLWHANIWGAHKTRVLPCELVKDIAIYLLFNPHNAQKLSLEMKCVINSHIVSV